MKIYGIYRGQDYDGYLLQEPLYMHLSNAIKSAEGLIKIEQVEIDDMRKHGYKDYKKWIKEQDYVWKGGFNNQELIKIEAIELIK